jgi:hypothetical protein
MAYLAGWSGFYVNVEDSTSIDERLFASQTKEEEKQKEKEKSSIPAIEVDREKLQQQFFRHEDQEEKAPNKFSWTSRDAARELKKREALHQLEELSKGLEINVMGRGEECDKNELEVDTVVENQILNKFGEGSLTPDVFAAEHLKEHILNLRHEQTQSKILKKNTSTTESDNKLHIVDKNSADEKESSAVLFLLFILSLLFVMYVTVGLGRTSLSQSLGQE